MLCEQIPCLYVFGEIAKQPICHWTGESTTTLELLLHIDKYVMINNDDDDNNFFCLFFMDVANATSHYGPSFSGSAFMQRTTILVWFGLQVGFSLFFDVCIH